MHKTARKMVVALSLLCLLVLTACQSGEKGESEKVTSDKKAKVVNIMETSGIPNASPTLADNSVSFRVINQIFEGLYRLDKNGKPALALAASEPEEKDGGKTLIFKIREDANWSNGDPVTAQDFEYAWKKKWWIQKRPLRMDRKWRKSSKMLPKF